MDRDTLKKHEVNACFYSKKSMVINGNITHPGTKAEGLLMNLRAVSSTFEDRNKPEFVLSSVELRPITGAVVSDEGSDECFVLA